jgi:Spy/CpxP family protein refolding chaperone
MGFGPLELLRRQDVRKELELLDEQVQQLAGLEEKQRNAMFDSLRRFNDRIAKGDRMPRREPGDAGRPRDPGNAGPPPDPRASFEQSNQALRNELSQILLPHQLKRLDQLQMQMRMRGGTMALFGREVAQELGITDDQREQLRPQVEGIERETQRKIAEIRRQAQQQVISLLSPDQQAKFRDLVGDPFEFANEPPPPQGPPPGSGPGPRGPARNP